MRVNNAVKVVVDTGQREEAGTVMVGPCTAGPKLCLQCQQPFREGERWMRSTSPLEPEFGAYSIGIHEKCVKSVT